MKDKIDAIFQNVRNVILGKDEEILNIMKGILAGGHILIEDRPGLGKTTLVKALARSMDLEMSRIQFTPDLLPSDITGISIYNPKNEEFEFRPGPVFTNLVIADEINRTSPKTQAALLEVMEEGQVSEGTMTYRLQKPFVVLATQNPMEFEGTFRLPEAQLDRFIMKATIGYPSLESERAILKHYRKEIPMAKIAPVVSRQDVLDLMKQTQEVAVDDVIYDYIARLARATRESDDFLAGVSPRASLALLHLAQASALLADRDYVIPEDVKDNLLSCFSHRLHQNPNRPRTEGGIEALLTRLMDEVEAPR